MSQTGLLRPSLITLLGAAFICLSSAQANTFYKWVDAEGVTHYGTKPPEEQDATKIQTSGQAASDAARGEAVSETLKKNTEAQTKARQQKIEADGKAKTNSELAEELKKNCEQAKKNAATLSTSPRVREKDAEGNFRYLAPEEQQKRINETQEYISSNCGDVNSN